MAWTAPRTWTDGELVTKAIMDPHIRDNFLAVGPHLIVRKPSDESLASSTTLQDDDHLQLTVAANDAWYCRYVLLADVPVTPDIKIAFTFPASGRVAFQSSWFATDGTVTLGRWGGTTTPTAAVAASGNTNQESLIIEGLFVNSSTAGTLILQWAQNTSDASAVVMKTHSTLWAVKLA
jgi:hypothetical protein